MFFETKVSLNGAIFLWQRNILRYTLLMNGLTFFALKYIATQNVQFCRPPDSQQHSKT
jgi:hypothetical protein